jgi:hypothetical protein
MCIPGSGTQIEPGGQPLGIFGDAEVFQIQRMAIAATTTAKAAVNLRILNVAPRTGRETNMVRTELKYLNYRPGSMSVYS